jgi:hypothetical protein
MAMAGWKIIAQLWQDWRDRNPAGLSMERFSSKLLLLQSEVNPAD